MSHVITSLCLRDGGCVTVCPVECIVPGSPVDKYPLFYIDPETCIDCGACVPECPFGAIFPLAEVSSQYIAQEGQHLFKPVGTPGFVEKYDGVNYEHDPVHLKSTKTLKAGEVIDLTPDIGANADFFKNGPGYNAIAI